MNHVKFMFNRINNYDLLYEDIMEGNQEWGENTKRVEDHTKEYVTQVMKDIMPNLLNKSTLKCLGCLERIANEVFALETDSAEYKITFTIDTFQNKDARIIIDIVPKYIYEGIEKCYDRYLEKLKIEIKKRMNVDWKRCDWLIDEPSEALCTELYSEFFKLENRIRSFVSRVLTLHLGVDWLSSCGLEKYYNSAIQLSETFKQKVLELDDINAELISLTLESVFEIVFKCKVYENDIVLSRAEYVQLEKILTSGKENENAKNFILKRRKKIADIWEDILKQFQCDPCFDIEEIETTIYDGKTHFFDIKCKALEHNTVEVYVEMFIDDDMGESSSCSIICKTEIAEIFRAKCLFVNGSGCEGDECLMQAEQDSEYDDSEVEELKLKLIKYVIEKLNPMIAQLNLIKEDKKKLKEFVSDNECEECGNFGISIKADFYPIGKCCYCGTEN